MSTRKSRSPSASSTSYSDEDFIPGPMPEPAVESSTIIPGRPYRPRAKKARAAALAPAPEQPETPPAPAPPPPAPATQSLPALQADSGEVARLQTTLAAFRQALVERQANQEAIENGERARAKSPVAYIMEVVSCRWAVEHWGEETAPRYEFPTRKCYQGKDQPDQDCRECQYVKLLRYGNHPHLADERRYMDHGMVIPIPDEATAVALADAATKLGLRPLRRVQHEIEMLQRQVVNLESQLRAAHQRELEAAQGARR